MWVLGPIGFAAPLALIALAILPVLWWLLRVTPPAPKIVAFPGIRLLRDLVRAEETPARTPLWLILFRLALLACVIVALAEPIWRPQTAAPAGSTLLLVVDNGWAAGANWPARQAALGQLLDRADHAGQQVSVLATASTAENTVPVLLGPDRAAGLRGAVEALRPEPWPVDRQAALAALQKASLGDAEAVWLADGLDSPGAAALGQYLAKLAAARLIEPDRVPHLLAPPTIGKQGLTATVLRPAGHAEPVTISATRTDGSSLGTAVAEFKNSESKATALFALPIELANEIDRLQIAAEPDAGTTFLLDQRWRRRPVGLVAANQDNTVLSGSPYLKAALEPFGEVRSGTIESLLKRPLSTLILDDPAAISEGEQAQLKEWMGQGGVLIRFAGPHLNPTGDTLLPVKLRQMERALGGALSWEKPAHLAPFPPGSPFAGLILPDDITVDRQVLAEPTADLSSKIWASLTDGTPLVTAAAQGKGWLVLVHTTAGPDWSNLSLSGGFIELLRRLCQLGGVEGDTASTAPATPMLAPLATLDGFGTLGDPPPTALPVAAADFETAMPGPTHPPGYYGSQILRRALNLGPAITVLAALPESGLPRGAYNAPAERSLKPALLAAALLALAADTLIGLWLKGMLPAIRRRTAFTAALLLCLLTPAAHAAQDVAGAATHTTLGYVLTGNGSIDQMSADGLKALATVLISRTSIEEAATQAVNIETDDLAVYPLLYWPVRENAAAPSPAAVARINAYLSTGGMILFDTGDQQFGDSTAPGQEALGHLAAKLDIPALEPIPAGHTLGKSFYLLSTFPGRYAGGPLWVERHGPDRTDSVSSVIIGGNDWAAAWATDENGQPLAPMDDRQRELAYRFGVNVVMYALTGNYKSDQVFTPYILQRLGQ